jgi:NadR type nicotinamide-nucleotide adenylyltransferase
MLNSGVVVGKFYPFHKGHKFLIETALHHCQYVTVLVDDKAHYKIPAYLRANWIRESFKAFGSRVVVQEFYNDLPDTDSKKWAAATIDYLNGVPDACITSENYGETWAREMGCTHILADKARGVVPISGTELRENMFGDNMQYLEAHVRRHFVNTVCIVGAESTGKSTLADGLADHFGICAVGEFGREYTENLADELRERGWKMSDFEFIAERQDRMEQHAILKSKGLVILDTDAMVTQAFCRRDMHAASSVIEALIKPQTLYILCPTENPFEADGWRKNGDEREALQDYYRDFLRGRKHVEVHGTHDERMAQAIEAINSLPNMKLPVNVKG